MDMKTKVLWVKILKIMFSNCCGAAPSFLSEDRCGDCLEWAEFDDLEENEY